VGRGGNPGGEGGLGAVTEWEGHMCLLVLP